jgi:hypothetical protein
MAAVVAWLPMAILLTQDTDSDLAIGLAARLLLLPMIGSFLIGLPLALLVLRQSSNLHFRKLLMIANGAGMALVFVSFLFGHVFGAFFYGLPSILAANAFAILGWLLIVRPSLRSNA